MAISRRALIKAGVGVGVLSAAGVTYHEVSKINTNARILVVGGGAAGIGISNMLLRNLDGAKITLVEPRDFHWYQPGQTLLLAGSYTTQQDVVSPITTYLDNKVTWKQDKVMEFMPDQNKVRTAGGETIEYDYLIVSTGLELRYDLIEGMDTQQIGKNGLSSIYFSPQAGISSYHQAQAFVTNPGNGKAIFTRPQGAMKCAGAPLKATNLVEYFAQKSPHREQIDFNYYTSEAQLFSVKPFDQKLKDIWQERKITANYHHVLSAIDIDKKTATFTVSDERKVTHEWDFMHLVPPMTPPKVVRESVLADETKFSGYLEVDPYSLQHKVYKNVFGLGDCVGTPIGKTAASVKSQLPVVTNNICSLIRGASLYAKWDGYTSCPMILDVGHAMLWEFDYSLQPVTALPFKVVDPLSESAIAWQMEETFLRPVYDIMLNGYTPI